jgi:murein L,D-transpeptidase YafK
MRAVRVAVVGLMVGTMMAAMALAVGCGPTKKARPPQRILADEDRLEWAKDEPTFIVIRKSCRTLDVYWYGQRVRSYPAVFGQAGPGERKLYEGDLRTPTGLYAIIGDRWHERWEHFFLLDYPNAADARRYEVAMAYDEIPVRGRVRAAIGGAVGIHGTDKPWLNRERVDWTWGCISIDNDHVRELASLVYVGTPVLIED